MKLILLVKGVHVATNINLEEIVIDIGQENRDVKRSAIKTTTANITSIAQPIGVVCIHGVMKREQHCMLGTLTKSHTRVYIITP